VGVSSIVDVGLAADLGVLDVVEWATSDPRTEVIVVILRAEPPVALVRELATVHKEHKPLVLLTPQPRPSKVHDLVRATSLADLADLAMLLQSEIRPPGRRVVVVTNDSSPSEVEANEELARRAILGPDLTQHTEMRIRFLSPGSRSRGAIVALPADEASDAVHDVVETLVEDPGVDALVVDDLSTSTGHHALWPFLASLPSSGPQGRPLPLVVAVDPRHPGQHGPVPAFASVIQALDGLARTCRR